MDKRFRHLGHERLWVPLLLMLSAPLCVIRAQSAPQVVPARPGQAEALAQQRAAANASPPPIISSSASPHAGTPQPAARVAASKLDQTLDRLAFSATDFTHHVKDAVCHEEIDSERQSTPGPGPRVLPAHVHAVSELQLEIRGEHIAEHRTWISQDGRPINAGQEANLPYKLTQAFAVPPSAYLSAEHRSCLRFSVQQADRFDFQATPLAGRGICSDIGPQAAGYILFDPQTDRIRHIERSVPVIAGAAGGFAPFAAVDYGPTEKNGRSYLLPTRIVATRQNRGYALRFDARYSCRILGSIVTLTTTDGVRVE